MNLKFPTANGTRTVRLSADAINEDLRGHRSFSLDLTVGLDGMFCDFEPDDAPALLLDLSNLAVAELQSLCGQAFQEMNKDFPRFGARNDYETLCDELQRRSEI